MYLMFWVAVNRWNITSHVLQYFMWWKHEKGEQKSSQRVFSSSSRFSLRFQFFIWCELSLKKNEKCEFLLWGISKLLFLLQNYFRLPLLLSCHDWILASFHLLHIHECATLTWFPSRSKWHGSLPRKAHLWPAQPPEGVHGPQLDHGGRQHLSVPSPGPQACAQGADGPHLTPHRHVQEDAGVGCGGHRPGSRPAHHSGGHPAHCVRPQLHLLVLEGLLQLKARVSLHLSTGCNKYRMTNLSFNNLYFPSISRHNRK